MYFIRFYVFFFKHTYFKNDSNKTYNVTNPNDCELCVAIELPFTHDEASATETSNNDKGLVEWDNYQLTVEGQVDIHVINGTHHGETNKAESNPEGRHA